MKFRYEYLIACAITSIGTYIICAKQFRPFDVNKFLYILPMSWLLVLCFALGFGIFLGVGENK